MINFQFFKIYENGYFGRLVCQVIMLFLKQGKVVFIEIFLGKDRSIWLYVMERSINQEKEDLVFYVGFVID